MSSPPAPKLIELKNSDDVEEAVAFKSSDGVDFEMEEAVALQSEMINLTISPQSPNMNMIQLRSSDDVVFEVEEAVALQSQMIKHTIENYGGAGTIIPLTNVTSNVLAKVIEYCKRHAGDLSDVEAFDAEFVNVEHEALFNLILAANYLHIQSLLDLTCQAVAEMIKAKTPDEIRNFFNIIEFTPEEEEEVRRENALAFE